MEQSGRFSPSIPFVGKNELRWRENATRECPKDSHRTQGRARSFEPGDRRSGEARASKEVTLCVGKPYSGHADVCTEREAWSTARISQAEGQRALEDVHGRRG